MKKLVIHSIVLLCFLYHTSGRQAKFLLRSTTTLTTTSTISTSANCYTTTAAITTACSASGRKKRAIVESRIPGADSGGNGTVPDFWWIEPSGATFSASNGRDGDVEYPVYNKLKDPVAGAFFGTDQVEPSVREPDMKSVGNHRNPRYILFYTTTTVTSLFSTTTTTSTTTFTLISCTPAAGLSLCG